MRLRFFPPRLFFGIAVGIFLIPKEAYAYLDPGSGSLIFQVLIAVFLGSFFTIRAVWKKIFVVIKRFFKRKNDS